MVGLGDLPGGGFSSSAQDITPDGRVIVGFGLASWGYHAWRWTAAGGMQDLGELAGGSDFSAANAVSADGQVVVGQSSSDRSGSLAEAFRWSPNMGLVGLGDLPGGEFNSIAYGCNADGSVIVGEATTSDGAEAFIWDDQLRMRSVRDALIAADPVNASTLQGWRLTTATAVSADGRIIVGYGINPSGIREAWSARLPRGCYANCDGSGGSPAVSMADYICFQQRFAGGSDYANCDGSTTPPVLNAADFLCFQARFVAGCP
jgi:probable HAF family extracellular repeat protein